MTLGRKCWLAVAGALWLAVIAFSVVANHQRRAQFAYEERVSRVIGAMSEAVAADARGEAGARDRALTLMDEYEALVTNSSADQQSIARALDLARSAGNAKDAAILEAALERVRALNAPDWGVRWQWASIVLALAVTGAIVAEYTLRVGVRWVANRVADFQTALRRSNGRAK